MVSQLSDFFLPILSFWELWERYGGLGERPGGLRERQEASGKKSFYQNFTEIVKITGNRRSRRLRSSCEVHSNLVLFEVGDFHGPGAVGGLAKHGLPEAWEAPEGSQGPKWPKKSDLP